MSASITPALTVRDAGGAAEFYSKALGAIEKARHVAPNGIVVVTMEIDGAEFLVVDENPPAFNVSPQTLGGTTVRISLVVDDPDHLAARAIAAGAREIFPVSDQPYGMRQGRVQDPYGHHWLIGKPLPG